MIRSLPFLGLSSRRKEVGCLCLGAHRERVFFATSEKFDTTGDVGNFEVYLKNVNTSGSSRGQVALG